MFSKFQELKKQKSPWINRYTVVLASFMIWMLFFDRHNVFSQHFLIKTVNRLESEKQRYDKGVEETRQLKEEINQDIEKFAREKYYMHKSDEEVFVFK
jgi:cell division protein FtsB